MDVDELYSALGQVRVSRKEGGDAAVPLSLELLRSGVCPRCCARQCGLQRREIYTSKAVDIDAAARRVLGSGALLAACGAAADASGGAGGSATKQVRAVCTLCLGLLQDGVAAVGDPPVPVRKRFMRQGNFERDKAERAQAAAARAANGEVEEKELLPPSKELAIIESLLDYIRRTGHVVRDFGIFVALPASLLIRQQALRAFIARDLKFTGVGGYKPEEVELKEIFRTLVMDAVCDALGAKYDQESLFRITLTVTHPDLQTECDQLPFNDPKAHVRRRKRLHKAPPNTSNITVSRLLEETGRNSVPDTVPCPPVSPSAPSEVGITVKREPVLLTGNYCKLGRGLSQSPWYIDGVRRGDDSVEELIADVVAPPFKGTSHKFHTAGREDIDVRMMGKGRPFVLEIIDAHVPSIPDEALAALQDRVNLGNDALQINSLRPATNEYFDKLKAGAERHRKTYVCVCWSARRLSRADLAKLDSLKDLAVAQRTPVRVLHRRSLAVRHKVIHALSAEWINPRYFILRLTTSAGAYVKEFVHGDLGRTSPNLGTILNSDCDILQLDVCDLLEPDSDDDAKAVGGAGDSAAAAAVTDGDDGDDGGPAPAKRARGDKV